MIPRENNTFEKALYFLMFFIIVVITLIILFIKTYKYG